jgi:hypothetical protein
VTLTDQKGNECTIKNVLYVLDHDSSLLSMMQLQKHGLNFALKSDDDSSGALALSSRTTAFRLDGKAVDGILYTRDSQDTSMSTRCHHQCLGWRMLTEQIR